MVLARVTLVAFSVLFFGCAITVPREEEAVVEPDDDGRTAEAVHGTMTAGANYVTNASLNLRAGAGRSYSVLTVMAKGTKVTAVGGGATNGYYQVKTATKTGWAHGDYLDAVVADPPPPPPGGGGSTAACSSGLGPALTCDGPSGYTSKRIPSNHLYSTSWFGCYRNSDGSVHTDPDDNCLFACGSMGNCPSGISGPECQARLRWFSADADRYGCGAKIRVTACKSGKSVVLVALDRGPRCGTVESSSRAPVLDMSHDAMTYLYGGAYYGGPDRQAVVVEVVDKATPLGPN